MNTIIIALLLGIFGFFLITFSLKKCNKTTFYAFKNIAIASLYPLVTIFLLIAVIEMNKNVNISFIEMLKLFSARYAQISFFIFIIFLVFMLISNIELVRKEGMNIKNLVGSFLQLCFICGTIGIFIIAKSLTFCISDFSSPFLVFLREFIPLYFYALISYLECITIGTMIMGVITSRQKPKYDKDFIIIPGCSIKKDGGLLPLLRGRVNRAVKFAWEQEIANGKTVRYVPSGGKGSDEIMSEGSAMEIYLLAHGSEQYEIFPEKKSINTYENFLYSKEIILAQKKDAKIAFSTTNYHVLRCGMIAYKLGIDIEGISSSTKWYFWPNGFAREIIAIFYMFKKVHIINAILLLLLSVIISCL